MVNSRDQYEHHVVGLPLLLAQVASGWPDAHFLHSLVRASRVARRDWGCVERFVT